MKKKSPTNINFEIDRNVLKNKNNKALIRRIETFIMVKSIPPCKSNVRKTHAATKTCKFRPSKLSKTSEKRVWSHILSTSGKQYLDEIVAVVPRVRSEKYYWFVRKLLPKAKNEIMTTHIVKRVKQDLDRLDFEDHTNRSAFLRTMSFRIDYKIPIKSDRHSHAIVKLHRAFCVLEDQNGKRATVKFNTSSFKKALRDRSEFADLHSFYFTRTLNFRIIATLMCLPIASAVQSNVFKFLE
jgi:hypothetical protein